MAFAGDDSQILVFAALLHEPVVFVDAAAVSFAAAQRLRFADAFHKSVSRSRNSKGSGDFLLNPFLPWYSPGTEDGEIESVS